MQLKTLIFSGILGLIWTLFSLFAFWAVVLSDWPGSIIPAGFPPSILLYTVALPTMLSFLISDIIGVQIALLGGNNISWLFFWFVLPAIFATLLIQLFIEARKGLFGKRSHSGAVKNS